MAASGGHDGACPPQSEALPPPPQSEGMKWQKSAIFSNYFDFCSVRYVFCPLDGPHWKNISGAATAHVRRAYVTSFNARPSPPPGPLRWSLSRLRVYGICLCSQYHTDQWLTKKESGHIWQPFELNVPAAWWLHTSAHGQFQAQGLCNSRNTVISSRDRGEGELNFFSCKGVRPGFPKCGPCELIFASERTVLWTKILIWGLRAKIWAKIDAVEAKISQFFSKGGFCEPIYKLFRLKWDSCQLRQRRGKVVFGVDRTSQYHFSRSVPPPRARDALQIKLYNYMMRFQVQRSYTVRTIIRRIICIINEQISKSWMQICKLAWRVNHMLMF